MKELYDPQLTEWLQLSGEYIGRGRPAEERVGWILFLFDEVKQFLTGEEYAQLVAEVKAALDGPDA